MNYNTIINVMSCIIIVAVKDYLATIEAKINHQRIQEYGEGFFDIQAISRVSYY
jgi:hypothetical protein